MSTERAFDTIVVGLGGMGSAACAHLARRGQRVLGLDRYGIPHEMGSSHGITRIIRLAYYESPAYVSLLQRAFVLWRELEARAGERLLVQTGSVDAALPGNWVVDGSIASCVEHGLDHEVLDGAELARRFPGYQLPAEARACFQPDGGFLLPERCIVAHAEVALAAGAELHGHEPVLDWSAEADGSVRVHTTRASYRADRMVLAAGAWMGELAAPLAGVAVAERQVLGWFQPRRPERFRPDTFPVFNLELDGERCYGLPAYGIPGFKIGRYHHLGESGHPDELRAEPDGRDEALLRATIARHFPDADGPVLSMRTCLFTNVEDEHFVVDTHPDHPQVVLASPCSGHGFKFASVMGEILADLAQRGETRHDIGPFRLARLGAGASA
ncbi:MAG: N-methyl-L-tryptophan oxidase [Acidimicrobiia bacterium]|nr:N-methyl-L-tryptophan oxidase [Acidimicrobiia bacterium]